MIFQQKQKDKTEKDNALVVDMKAGHIDTELIKGVIPGRKRRYGKNFLYFVKRDIKGNLTAIEPPDKPGQPPARLFNALDDPTAELIWYTEHPFWTKDKLKWLFVALVVSLVILWLVITVMSGEGA